MTGDPPIGTFGNGHLVLSSGTWDFTPNSSEVAEILQLVREIRVIVAPKDDIRGFCLICGEESDFLARMPYGSDYDDYGSGVVCADCIHRHLDPIIDLVHGADRKSV